MTRWGKIKCSLGFHDWEKWEATDIEMIDRKTGKAAYEVTVQIRNCQRCNLQEQRP
uniref:Uncharacterized protein n=1 Tax=uncultured Caudovirales phage TaxID=2100421 RepID=A0A6J5LZ77_9CAUD|nr:hypothetical protein UFOVP354_61 [uncultured Caudovirales phage]